MFLFTSVLIITILGYISSSAYHQNGISNQNDETNHRMLNTTNIHEKLEEREIAIMKKKLSLLLREENIYRRIKILEEFKEYETISTKDIEDSISWDSVFTKENETEIKFDAKNLQLEDDFVLRLKMIIDEIYADISRYNRFISEEGLYSTEMMNNCYFLAEITSDYFSKFKFKIISLVIKFYLGHQLTATELVEKEDKIQEIITNIKKHNEELRRSILPQCNTFTILNNLSKFGFLQSGLYYTCFLSYTSNFITETVVNCHESIQMICRVRIFKYDEHQIFASKLVEAIDMEEIYENLEILEKNWESRYYTSYKCCYITLINFYIIACRFPFVNVQLSSLLDRQLGNIYEYTKELDYSQPCFAAFLVLLLPVEYPELLLQQYSERLSSKYKIFYEDFLKIVDYRKYLLNEDTGEASQVFLDLLPNEKLKSISAVMGCYSSYLSIECEDCEISNRPNNYDIKCLNAIINCVIIHLKNMQPDIFSLHCEKYLKFCYALKKLTSKTTEYNSDHDYESYSDYPHLSEFYGEYKNIGLEMDLESYIDEKQTNLSRHDKI